MIFYFLFRELSDCPRLEIMACLAQEYKCNESWLLCILALLPKSLFSGENVFKNRRKDKVYGYFG